MRASSFGETFEMAAQTMLLGTGIQVFDSRHITPVRNVYSIWTLGTQAFVHVSFPVSADHIRLKYPPSLRPAFADEVLDGLAPKKVLASQRKMS